VMGGEGGFGLFSKPKMTSFMDSPLKLDCWISLPNIFFFQGSINGECRISSCFVGLNQDLVDLIFHLFTSVLALVEGLLACPQVSGILAYQQRLLQ